MQELSRAEFFGWDGTPGYFDYRRGEHAAWIYPTQKGKTHLAWQALQSAMRQNPGLTPVTLMPKALSPSTGRWAEALGFREVSQWPAPSRLLGGKPPGYVVWPKHDKSLPVAENRARKAVVIRKAMTDMLNRGNCIMFADDLHVLSSVMGLSTECEEYWTTAAEGGAGLWGANQKPSGTQNGAGISTYFYSAPTHYFLGKDTHEANIKRFGEIGGGVDPREVASIVRGLKQYQIPAPGGPKMISQVLYIDSRGPYKALIGPLRLV